MAFKPNYGQQRNERRRSKESKKQEKLERRAAKRKDDDAGDASPVDADGASPPATDTPPAEDDSGR